MAVANAQVQFAGQTAVTAADGHFSFAVTSSSESMVMLIKKVGYATNAKDVPLKSGATTNFAIKLFADQVSKTFDAAAGSTLSMANGASAVIPARGLQTSAGVIYTGTVTAGASYFGPDTLDGVLAFPAPYVGTDAGVQAPLITAGVIEVKLTDAAGNLLQLKAGSPATLTYPATSVSAGAASIPMWYYDETSKMWLREGVATLQSNGMYQASVSHFTPWNIDFPVPTATIKGCFQDALGRPISAAGLMRLRGTGWDRILFGTAPNADGNFTINWVPSGTPLELYSNTAPSDNSILTQTEVFSPVVIPSLAAGEVRQLACVVVKHPPLDSTFFATPPFTLFTTSAGSFAGIYTGTYAGAEYGTFIVTVDPFGQISGSVNSTTYPLVYSVTGNLGATGTVSLLATGQAGSARFQGTALGAGRVSGTWMYTSGSGGSGTFSGQRN
jgi:hypothetical protein